MFLQIFLKWHCITLLVLCLSIFIFHLITPSIINSLDINKCPLCFGETMCDDIMNSSIEIHSNNLTDKLKNFISSKNVFVANYGTERVILKKLAHNSEWESFDKEICEKLIDESKCDINKITKLDIENKIKNLLSIKTFDNKSEYCINGILCPNVNKTEFLNLYYEKGLLPLHIWTMLQINPEPLILTILNKKDGWPVPYYYGACGRFIVEEHCGDSLLSFTDFDWFTRADLALQLLQAASMFTNAHPKYRFYLTDVSPDNIVVDLQNRIKFIDLENIVILERKNDSFDKEWQKEHQSENFECENCFEFSQTEICKHYNSDHNFFGICKLLLHSKSPWPMVEGGLLHSIPLMVKEGYPKLITLLNDCVEPSNLSRFDIANELIEILEHSVAQKHDY